MPSDEITSTETTSMETRQLHSSQKEALKKILEFSGESNELDIDEWLFDLTNLYSLMKLNDETNFGNDGKINRTSITMVPRKSTVIYEVGRNREVLKRPIQGIYIGQSTDARVLPNSTRRKSIGIIFL
jgi:hypothetical protein